MRTWLIALLASLIFTMLAAPLAIAWYILYTEPGINLLVRHLPERFAGIDMTLQGVRGNLAHGLHIDHLQILQRRVHLNFDDIDLTLDLAPAFLQTVHARRLEIGTLHLEVIRRTSPYVPAPLFFLPHWLNVRIDALHVARGTLLLPSGRQLEAADLRTHGLVQARIAHYYDATMRSGDIGFSSHSGVLHATYTLGVAADLGLDYHLPDAVPWQVRAQGDGDLNSLPFTARVMAPFQATFKGTALDLTNQWHFEGKSQITHVALDTWGGSPRLGSAHGELDLTFNNDGFTAAGPVISEALDVGVFDAQLHGSYAQHTLNVQQFSAFHKTSGTRLTAVGTASVEHGGPRLHLTGAWTHFSWPLVHTPALRSESGTYAIAGIFPYDLTGSGDLAIPRLPVLNVVFTTAVYPEHIQFNTATVSGRTAEIGHANFSGSAQWLPHYAWSATGTATDLNPAAFADIAAGRLNFGFQAAGAGFRASDDFNVQVQNLSGVMHDLPARGSGRVSRTAALWHLDEIRAQLAGTNVSLDGTVGHRADQPFADLKFEIRSPDLSLLVPGLKGHISGSGQFSGAWRDPAVQATVSAGALQYQNLLLAEVTARLDFDPQRTGPSHVDVHARGLSLGTRHA